MARAPRPGSVNVRLRLEELAYLTEQADRLEVTLSESVRAAIARSYLTDKAAGRTEVESWINAHDDTLLDVDES